MNCNICGNSIPNPIYESKGGLAITSLCEFKNAKTKVYHCNKCSHLMSQQIDGIDQYYAEDYKILLDHEEEDQIYDMNNGVPIYRAEHQLSLLLSKIQLEKVSTILDYGCAKSIMTRRLLKSFPNCECYLFDVSDMYVKFWENFLPKSRCATFSTPNNWALSFDLVTSYFSLEHVSNPNLALQHIHSLLREGGMLFGIVPNVFSNPADFVVVDHVNHFTNSSLRYLLAQSGYTDVQIDSHSYRGAWVFTAKKESQSPGIFPLVDIDAKAFDLAEYWANITSRIEAIEEVSTSPYAIYGSGFYGAYIFANLSKKDRVKCFIDQNPFQQRKKLFDREILSPSKIPSDIKTVFVGLNPSIAVKAIQGIPELNTSNVNIKFI